MERAGVVGGEGAGAGQRENSQDLSGPDNVGSKVREKRGGERV